LQHRCFPLASADGAAWGVSWAGVGAGVGAGCGVVSWLGWAGWFQRVAWADHPTPSSQAPPLSPPPSIAFKSPGFKLPLPGPLATFPRQRCHLPLRGRVPWCCWVGRFARGRGTPSRFIRPCYPTFPLYLMHSDEKRRFGCKMARVQVRAGLPLLALVPHSPLPSPCLPPPPPPPLPIPIVLRVRGVTHRAGQGIESRAALAAAGCSSIGHHQHWPHRRAGGVRLSLLHHCSRLGGGGC
jgi:hypothetical protein